MEYFALFNLQREPFGNSPDPEMFYHTVPHRQCLHELETAIRLRRGLNVVIGEIGTGKSTLCRQLIRNLNEYGDPVAVHLLLEPEFATPREFLLWIADSCNLPKKCNSSDRQLKEMFKNYLFEQVADQPGIVTLIIDEGQKLPGPGLDRRRPAGAVFTGRGLFFKPRAAHPLGQGEQGKRTARAALAGDHEFARNNRAAAGPDGTARREADADAGHSGAR